VNQQKGMSSLMLVLLMLVLGSLTLQGMSMQHQSQLKQTTLELRAMQDTVNAESLLEGGRMFAWETGPGDRCQSHTDFAGRVCLRIFSDDSALLIANSGEQYRWQTGQVQKGTVQFDRSGWSDFCPRKEVLQCQIP